MDIVTNDDARCLSIVKAQAEVRQNDPVWNLVTPLYHGIRREVQRSEGYAVVTSRRSGCVTLGPVLVRPRDLAVAP